MDHSYGLGRRTDACPETIAVGARIVSFIHGGGRLVVLAGPPGPGTSNILDLVLDGMPARVLRVRNRSPAPLGLTAILAQVSPGSGDADEPAALLRCIGDRYHADGPTVLAIDGAHGLTPNALAALARVPGLGGPDMPGAILLLAGEFALTARLAERGLERLRDPAAALAIRLPGLDEPEPAPTPAPRPIEPAPASPARSTAVGAITALIMASVLLLRPSGTAPVAPALQPPPPSAIASIEQAPPPPPPTLAQDPLPAAEPPATAVPTTPAAPPASQAAEPAPAPIPDPAPLLATPAIPAPPPAPVAELVDVLHPTPSPENPLRKEFDAFLNTAGRDTALLTPEAREALFREYLAWRARSAPTRLGNLDR